MTLLLGLLLVVVVLVVSAGESTGDRYRECRTEHSVGRCIEAALLGADPDSLAGGDR